ncbi:MAG TPA: PAS domain-containing protein, partial [Phenylobacterium sp.]
ILFRACPLPEPSGEVLRWCGINVDIHDRVLAEEAAREERRRLEDIIDGLPAIAALFSPTGKIIFCNRQMLDYLGETLEGVQAKPSAYNFHPDDRDEVLTEWVEATRSGRPFDREARLCRADGVYRWHRTRVFPLRNATGEVDVWYGLSTDIDDAKRAEAELATEKRVLELVARGVALPVTLAELCRQVEPLAPGAYCSILLIAADGGRFQVAASPNLPDSYRSFYDGKAIDRDDDPCSLAVALRTPVTVADLAKDQRWAGSPWSSRMADLGLACCWSVPILSGGGRVLGVFVLHRRTPARGMPDEQELIDRFTKIVDIAIERSEADAALKASEAELGQAYRQLTEAQRLSRTGSFTLDVTADDHNWSQELFPIFEFEVGSPISFERVRAVVHPDDLAQFEGGFARAAAGVAGFDGHFRILTPGGVLKYLHCVAHLVPQEDGRPVFVGALQDVTETRLAEEALKASEAELQRANRYLTGAQRLSHTGSFTWDAERDEHSWSEENLRIWELDAQTLTGEAVLASIHPEDLPTFEAVHARALAQGGDYELFYRIVTGSGAVKHLHTVAQQQAEVTDRFLFIGATQDITESRLAEEALNRARAQLDHVTRITALSALTASIAHEVSQPLAGIITNASTCLRMLAAETPNLDGARATAERTIRDANRASEVIQRLRALFARKQASMEPVDLNDAVAEVLTLSASDLQQRQVMLRRSFDEALPPVRGDRVQLQQVILNLVLNAADAMAGLDDRPRELCLTTARDDAGHVTLSVRDAGVGLAPEVLEHLFDPFFTTKAAGMGIGLSISRSIIQSHDGRLSAAPNDDGPGATFAFSLPRWAELVRAPASDLLSAVQPD